MCFWKVTCCALLPQLIDLLKAVSSMGLSQSEMDLVISARNVVSQAPTSNNDAQVCHYFA